MGTTALIENIPTLVKTSGVAATFATTNRGRPTLVRIGGQEYTPASTLTLGTGSVGAGGIDAGSLGTFQLWYVFLIVNQSSLQPALLASQSLTSPTIPVGYGTAVRAIAQFSTEGTAAIATVSGFIDNIPGIYPGSGGSDSTGAWTFGNVLSSITHQMYGKFQVGITAQSRYIAMDGTGNSIGILTLRDDDNSVRDQALIIQNRQGAGGAWGIGISFQLAAGTAGSTGIEAGNIQVVAAQSWTATASTQDSSMLFKTTNDGVSATNMTLDGIGNLLITGRYQVPNSGGTTGFGSLVSVSPSSTATFVVLNNGMYRVTIFSSNSSLTARVGSYIFIGLNKGASTDPVVLTLGTIGSPQWTFSYTLSGSNDTLVTVTSGNDNQGTRVVYEKLAN